MFTTIITNVDKLRIRRENLDSQQLLDNIIAPTLQYMGGNYDSKNARMLLLATAAIESKCGHYIKQINGPALGVWQMETATHDDIWQHCDAFNSNEFIVSIEGLIPQSCSDSNLCDLSVSPAYACAMARLKYSMDSEQLPNHKNCREVYDYYKRVYNTHLGASTYEKFKQAWIYHKLAGVEL